MIEDSIVLLGVFGTSVLLWETALKPLLVVGGRYLAGE